MPAIPVIEVLRRAKSTQYGVAAASAELYPKPFGACQKLLPGGIYTPWVVSRSLDFSFFEYMRRIYTRPLLTGVPIGLMAWFLKTRWLPGRTWFHLIAATLLIGIGYTALALFTCIEREHRSLLLSRIPFVGERLAAAVAA